MITSSREEGFSTKQEGSITDGKITTKASSSSTPWLKLKDPRIVRVSRAFGGKDRHSKVCTVKGLRDRRVRLSVPTAIQLYDLQDRLGLNQPSKVVDWLLNAAKDGIDELPPLQMPPGNFSQNNHPMLISHEVGASQHNKEGLKINSIFNLEDPRPNFWNSDPFLRSKSKGIAKETINEKENSTKRNDEEKQEGSTINEGTNAAQIPSNFFPRANNQSSLPGLFNNAMPYGSYYHWEPNSNLSLAHLGSHGLITSQLTDEVPHNFNVVPLPSTLSLPSGSQVLVCPPSATHSYFPPHVTAASVEFDPRQTNHFQMLSSSSQNPLSNSLAPPLYSISQSLRPFHLSMAPRPIHSQNNVDSEIHEPNKVTEFPSK